MNTQEKCWLCNGLMTRSKEHIIPKSIGGRKTITGFVCNSCNNMTGGSWDSELAEAMVIARSEGAQNYGKLPRVPDYRFNGESLYAIQRDGMMEFENKSGRTVTLNETGDIPIDIKYTINVMRSMLKSAMALAFCKGIMPAECGIAVPFVKYGDENLYLNRYFLQSITSFSHPSPTDMLHTACYGDRRRGIIICNIDWSYLKLWTVLSEDYQGHDFGIIYIVDRRCGEDYFASESDVRRFKKVELNPQMRIYDTIVCAEGLLESYQPHLWNYGHTVKWSRSKIPYLDHKGNMYPELRSIPMSRSAYMLRAHRHH